MDRLTSIDVHGWLRLNPLTLRTLFGYAQRTGAPLALLSNAPEPLARAIDRSPWSQHFDHRYYSCRLGAAKPDPRAFQLVLSDLGVPPDEVLFIDDRSREHPHRPRPRNAHHHLHLGQRPRPWLARSHRTRPHAPAVTGTVLVGHASTAATRHCSRAV